MNVAANSISQTSLLPLDAERTVTIPRGPHLITYHLRRVTEDDWRKYSSGIAAYTERRGSAEVEVYDANTAKTDLVSDCIITIDGCSEEFLSLPNWRELISLPHTIRVADALLNVDEAANPAGLVPGAIFVDICLRSTWNGVRYNSLVHRFAAPSKVHLRRYFKAASRTRRIGSKNLWPNAFNAILALYDELIIEVEGYAIAGRPLRAAEEIIQEMDSRHKACALNRLMDKYRANVNAAADGTAAPGEECVQ